MTVEFLTTLRLLVHTHEDGRDRCERRLFLPQTRYKARGCDDDEYVNLVGVGIVLLPAEGWQVVHATVSNN